MRYINLIQQPRHIGHRPNFTWKKNYWRKRLDVAPTAVAQNRHFNNLIWRAFFFFLLSLESISKILFPESIDSAQLCEYVPENCIFWIWSTLVFMILEKSTKRAKNSICFLRFFYGFSFQFFFISSNFIKFFDRAKPLKLSMWPLNNSSTVFSEKLPFFADFQTILNIL